YAKMRGLTCARHSTVNGVPYLIGGPVLDGTALYYLFRETSSLGRTEAEEGGQVKRMAKLGWGLVPPQSLQDRK
ncbi:hypothetical protein FRC07_003226, partial [Ceratobasidium sp. 392]